MKGWAWTSAVACGITLALFAAATAVAILAAIHAARADRLCECGHTFGEHQDLSLQGQPCTVCPSCVAFRPAGRAR